MTNAEITTIISSVLQTITTGVLAWITYKQMKLGKESVRSMERNTKAAFLPVLMLGHARHASTDKKLNIQLTNCGKGLAIKPKIIFPGWPDLTINSINVGETDNATIEYNMEFILKKVNECDRKIIIEYSDVFGRKISTEANLIEINKLGPLVDKPGIGWESWAPIIP